MLAMYIMKKPNTIRLKWMNSFSPTEMISNNDTVPFVEHELQ